MGHKNYSKFSQKQEENKEVVETPVIEKVIEAQTPEEIPIEVSVEKPIQEVTEEANQVIEEPIPEQVVETIGFVDGCDKLYVRKEGNVDAEPITIIKRSDEIVIDLENSTEYFYRVKTSEGVEGYCMKKFITIK